MTDNKMDGHDPFGFPPLTYVWVVCIGLLAGLVKNLNNMKQFMLGHLLVDCITAAFTALIAFWVCNAQDISGHWMAVVVGIAGWMGTRAWSELERLVLQRLGIPKSDKD